MFLYHTDIVYPKTKKELAVYKNCYLLEKDGAVEGIYPVIPESCRGVPVRDYTGMVMIPAFSDLHVHAPQYPQRGLAMDELLSTWLTKYTFPLEAGFSDPDYAHAVYDAFAEDLIANGTLHVCAFGTIHRETTGYLLEILEKKGIPAYIGKVNMDKASPDNLCETTEESLRETECFLEKYSANRFAKPILTPRFAPSVTGKLLSGLGGLGRKYGVGLQTHIVESKWEAAQARLDFPDASCDMEIYEKAGLLENGPVAAAHFIYPSDEDIRILNKYNGVAVQCPDATINIIAGIMRNSFLRDQGIRIALGSDIAGGSLPGIYTQIARSVQLSKIKCLYEPDGNEVLDFKEAFYYAVKEGGSFFGRTGSLEKGYRFDALVIGGLSDPFRVLSPEETVERFCYCGNPSHINARFLGGKELPSFRSN